MPRIQGQIINLFHKTFLLLSFVLISSLPLKAATRIEMVVNDQPITNYELQQRSKLIALTTRANSALAKRRAREELINETLKLQEAKRVGVKVQDKEVDSAYASIAARLKLSPANFSSALKQNGVNPRTLKKRLRAEIAWSHAVMRRFRATVRINESDVIAAMQSNGAKSNEKTVEYNLQRVLFVVPEKASKALVNKRKSEMKKLRSRFTSCTSGLELAKGLKEVVVKPVGRRLETEIPRANLEQLEKMSVGRLTAPTKVSAGYEMIALCGKRSINSDASARQEAEGELRNKEGQQMSRRYLRDLRTRAVIEQR
ncbi:SurA N-terminal domain-containing protein [Polycladidibacter stylochi]|uniref:SurA N-terminal domain-containing protein n=1 Tax=Polycladidibacter stylochi TaxID=1807766 RepID=UPI0009EAC004|nr:SurA N-terminal domain-containing protein [Pseudovibrio stylochi]